MHKTKKMVDKLIEKLGQSFILVKEHRYKNAQRKLADYLMSAFAMFHLKDASLHVYRKNYAKREENLHTLYKVECLYSDSALREGIDGIDPSCIKAGFSSLLSEMKSAKLLEAYELMDGYICCAIDGTQHYCSGRQKCPHCLEKKTQGEVQYYHQALAGVIVNPLHKEVFPVACEAIVKQDGSKKNDCEINAAYRLLPQIRTVLPISEYKLLCLLDALYANGKMIKALEAIQSSYIIVIKDGFVPIQIERLRQSNDVCSKTWINDKKHRCKAVWKQGLMLNGQHQDIKVNYFEYEEYDKRGKLVYKNSWITDLPISDEKIVLLVKIARSRWKVENETFNTLKNQGYHLEHNYGHGQKNLATNFMLLTFLAFLVDQIAQRADIAFQKAIQQCPTKGDLWEKIRSAFDFFAFSNWNLLYRLIAKEVKMQVVFLE